MEFYQHSSGKLLITGEYFVLDGAKGLALPTQMGQSMKMALLNDKDKKGRLIWKAYQHDHSLWAEVEYDLTRGRLLSWTDKDFALRLGQLLEKCIEENPIFYLNESYQITTELEFKTQWGLGTSSTLINNLANLFSIDPYKLLEQTFGGSGYDIACAQADGPIIYERFAENRVSKSPFNPIFKDKIHFVYLGNKQNSREGISYYRSLSSEHKKICIQEINELTEAISACNFLNDMMDLVREHEQLVSSFLKKETVQTSHFPHFNGVVKSLGAWGGDFVMVLSNESRDYVKDYFAKKDLSDCFQFDQIIKSYTHA